MSFLPPVFFAYLDPGTGSHLFQLALAGLLGAGFALKQSWSWLKGLGTRSQRSRADANR